MDLFKYSILEIDKILAELNTNAASGLDSQEVNNRLQKFGYNSLKLKRLKGWHIFFRQFKSAFIYLLLGALGITIALGEMVDSVIIVFFLIIMSGLGFYQEYSSEKVAQLLNRFTISKAKVLRNGQLELIPADHLVPGDIITMEIGDKVSADVRLIEVQDLSIDETVLTGESVPVFKKAETLEKVPASYHQAENLAFSGTDILKGSAKAVVLATGPHTVFGKIASLTSESKKVSDFEKGIANFSAFILKLVGLTLAIVFVAHLLIKQDQVNILELIVFSVALTVAVIPEGLPVVTTFALSQGARRLAKKHVIVKRLSAIEDLGSVEILCSDKTGTLTKNELSLAHIYSNNHPQTIWLANLASSFELTQRLEPFDIALEKNLTPHQRKEIKESFKIAEEPFDPQSRKNIVLVKTGDGYFLIERGAPEVIVPRCLNLNQQTKADINEWVKNEGLQGHRVLAIAFKRLTRVSKQVDLLSLAKRHRLVFAGLISFVDPVKESTYAAVKNAEQLGVRLVILTGDSPEVAGAVARQIKLIDSPRKVITGDEWRQADEAHQSRYLQEYSVFARVSPEDKFDIIKTLRQKYTVGFLGEGINDAPALKIAGVSLVVDSASDIAREAADIILLKKNLQVIIEGIYEGRRVFANTTKYIKTTLISNFGNFFAVATASLLIDFLPMLAIQILLLNLLSDTPMIAISTDNVDKADLKSPRQYETREIIIIAIILGLVSTLFDFIFFALFYHLPPAVLQTNWFIASVLTELVLIFSIRTKLLFFKANPPSPWLVYLSLMVFVVAIGLPLTPTGQLIFKFTPPTALHLIWIISLVFIYFIVSEMVKLLYYKHRKDNWHPNLIVSK